MSVDIVVTAAHTLTDVMRLVNLVPVGGVQPVYTAGHSQFPYRQWLGSKDCCLDCTGGAGR